MGPPGKRCALGKRAHTGQNLLSPPPPHRETDRDGLQMVGNVGESIWIPNVVGSRETRNNYCTIAKIILDIYFKRFIGIGWKLRVRGNNSHVPHPLQVPASAEGQFVS